MDSITPFRFLHMLIEGVGWISSALLLGFIVFIVIEKKYLCAKDSADWPTGFWGV